MSGNRATLARLHRHWSSDIGHRLSNRIPSDVPGASPWAGNEALDCIPKGDDWGNGQAIAMSPSQRPARAAQQMRVQNAPTLTMSTERTSSTICVLGCRQDDAWKGRVKQPTTSNGQSTMGAPPSYHFGPACTDCSMFVFSPKMNRYTVLLSYRQQVHCLDWFRYAPRLQRLILSR